MESPKVIPWNSENPNYNFETNPNLKLSYASAIGSAAANKAKQLNSARETEMAAANKFAEKNVDMLDKYASLSERGGKMKKRRSTKRKKSTRKARKTKRNARRRK
jgi:hypothetical protein